jgi:Zn-dependent peptidase ImmA (M78 family)
LGFVGRFSLNSPTEKIAADIRNEIGIDEQMRAESAPTVSAFLTQLVRSSEDLGLIVLRSGTVCGNTHKPLNVREFRGFALPDPMAPMLFINTKDAISAQIFTWAHEVAHVWLNASGVSLMDLSRKSKDQVNAIEAKCNEVAAEVLVPTASFSHNWIRNQSLQTNIANLRRRYRVSELVILRKAFDSDLITGAQFSEGLHKYYEVRLEEKLAKDEDKPSGGNFYNSLYARNSSTFTASVVESHTAGSVLMSEACSLLGVKRKVLQRLVAAA